jgi:hypothetical protein
VAGADVAHESLCGLVSALAAPQVPSPVPDCLSAAAQAWQKPHDVVEQQTPSMQLVLTPASTPMGLGHSRQLPAVLQSVARAHAAPMAFCGAHEPLAAQ